MGAGAGVGVSLLGVIKFIISVYDLLTGWIYAMFSNSSQKMKDFYKTRAVPTSPIRDGDTEVTYKPVQPQFKSSIIHDFENAGNKTMADVFSWAVARYGSKKFLGTRDILAEDDEVQPNGRIFAKLELGEYRCVSKLKIFLN